MPASEQEWQEFRDRAARAVRHGAALLDREQPEWFRKINPYHLDMFSCGRCVLGQLFGDFLSGSGTLKVDVYKHGFDSKFSDNHKFGPSAWMELGRCWREEIRRREADHG